jgi:hypothetical protein
MYYKVDYNGVTCVAKKSLFSNKYKLDNGVICNKSELTIYNRVFRPFVSCDIRESSFNNFYTLETSIFDKLSYNVISLIGMLLGWTIGSIIVLSAFYLLNQ